MKYWTRALSFSPQRRKLTDAGCGSLHDRLKGAYYTKALIAQDVEMEAFEGYENRRLRTKLMLADFYAGMCRWYEAERLYREIINSEHTTDFQKAVTMRCLARAHSTQGEDNDARRLLKAMVELCPEGPASFEMLYMTAGYTSKTDLKKSYELYMKAAEIAPDKSDMGAALACAATIARMQKKWDKARAAIRLMEEKVDVFPYNNRIDDEMEDIANLEAYHEKRENKNGKDD